MSLQFISNGWRALGFGEDPAIAETFTELEIRAGEECVTYVEDKKSQSTATHILVPLYPVAEWIVFNWWFLREESRAPNRLDYWERHSLAQGREGFAFPDLRLIPEGPVCRIEWRRWRTRFMDVNFLAEGEARMSKEALREMLGDFVEKVISRLRARNIQGTVLEREWEAVKGTKPEEEEFCRSAAWLGLDPYALAPEQEQGVMDCHERIPPTMREEVFRAAQLESLKAATEWVREGARRLPGATANGTLGKLRRAPGPVRLEQLPWEEGYRLARDVRKNLRAEMNVPFDMGIITGAGDAIVEAPIPPIESIEGISGVTEENELRCFTARKRKDARRFTAARGLLEWIYGEPGGPLLISGAITRRQQRNRAFAAELLAPAALMGKRLSGREISKRKYRI